MEYLKKKKKKKKWVCERNTDSKNLHISVKIPVYNFYLTFIAA